MALAVKRPLFCQKQQQTKHVWKARFTFRHIPKCLKQGQMGPGACWGWEQPWSALQEGLLLRRKKTAGAD